MGSMEGVKILLTKKVCYVSCLVSYSLERNILDWLNLVKIIITDPRVAVMKTEVQVVSGPGFHLSVAERLPQKHHPSPTFLVPVLPLCKAAAGTSSKKVWFVQGTLSPEIVVLRRMFHSSYNCRTLPCQKRQSWLGKLCALQTLTDDPSWPPLLPPKP